MTLEDEKFIALNPTIATVQTTNEIYLGKALLNSLDTFI